MNFKSKNIVITQLRLLDYAGSETVTLELAEFFSAKGANVAIVTNAYGYPIRADIEKIKNVTVLTTNSEELDDYLKANITDIVWVHHQILPLQFISNPGKAIFIFHHMSPYSELEYPNFWRIESALANSVLFNSEETKDRIIKDGILEHCVGIMDVFGNPAPDAYMEVPHRAERVLQKILIVSNHIPEELKSAASILQGAGISVVTLGAAAEKYQRLTPKIISDYDLVITIGKTAQYAIQAGVPLYCYDRFGGPGYLEKSSIERARWYNFSGRGFERISDKDIATSIVDGYGEALIFTDLARSKYKSDFSLTKRIVEVIERAYKYDRKKKRVNKSDIVSYAKLSFIIKTRTPDSAHKIGIQAKNDKDAILKSQSEIEALKRSWNYRVGSFILYVPKKIMKYTRRR